MRLNGKVFEAVSALLAGRRPLDLYLSALVVHVPEGLRHPRPRRGGRHPQRPSEDEGCARRLLRLAPQAPTPVWGCNALRAGEMWSSNPIISWLLVKSGLDEKAVSMSGGGRAPGWGAGLVVARRQGPF
ncbi:MAG: hypothetical protein WCP98_07965 [Actinomycetes bacterium]